MVPNSVSYCRAKPLKAVNISQAREPDTPLKKIRMLFYFLKAQAVSDLHQMSQALPLKRAPLPVGVFGFRMAKCTRSCVMVLSFPPFLDVSSSRMSTGAPDPN